MVKKDICNFLIVILGLTAFYCLFNFDIYKDEFLTFIICIIILSFIRYKLSEDIAKNKENNPSPSLLESNIAKYSTKNIMTPAEFQFFSKFRELEENYIIIPQLNLAAVIQKNTGKYHNELFRNIDFAILDKNYNLLLLIELNDKTHNTFKRRDRDLKVKKILQDCNIPMLTFYTCYPNDKQYVINRINKTLNDITIKSKNS